MFVRQFSIAKAHNGHQGNVNAFSGGLQTRQHPIYPDGMSEFSDHLVDELIVSDRPRIAVISVSGGIWGINFLE
jgi:hypothetical protein